MRAFHRVAWFGLLLALLPLASRGALTRQNNILGKFFVSAINGTATCIVDGRINEVKKGDSFMARGAVVETTAGSNLTIVFSNQTGVYVDEKTRFEVEKFDQEFFAPNNNLRVEPSNSSTIVKLMNGRLVISTPRLLSGTTMVYQTPHAAVGVRGEKLLIEANEKQTHVAMIAGIATVNPRDAEGNFVSIGKRLTTSQEAFVKYTLGGANPAIEEVAVAKGENPRGSRKAPAPAIAEVSVTLITKDTEALVLRLTGPAQSRLPSAPAEKPVAEGDRLPKGTLIHTDGQTELYLQAFDGAIATLRPNTTLQLEKLALTTDGSVIKKQTALLSLTAGTVISTIDPAKQEINDYAIRTPNGIASAHGTSFAVSVEQGGFSVATTADTVTFTTPEGATFQITAGNVSITPAGSQPQPPISLAAAVAANPAFAAVVQTALNVVTNIVRDNLGSLPPASALNLITKVAGVAAAALPGQATAITTQTITAVMTPSSSTASLGATAVSAVTNAIVSAAKDQAAPIAVAAALAAPAQAGTAAAAAAAVANEKEAPAIASAVAQTLVRIDAQGNVTPASLQAASALAAAVAGTVQNQAAPIAAAVMQALSVAAPLSTPQSAIQNAATIAATVTLAVPPKAVEIAATMMRTLASTQAMLNATPQILAQGGATLASAVISSNPEQAQPVATAVMQFLVQNGPLGSPDASLAAAGLMSAAVAQVAPGSADAVNQGLASVTNQSAVAIASSAGQFYQQAVAIGQQVARIGQVGAAAAQQGNLAFGAIQAASGLLAQSGAPRGGSGSGNVAGSGGSTGGPGQGNPGGGELGGAGLGGGTSDGADAGGPNSATSVIITQFDPSGVSGLLGDLEAAQTAQSGVQFDTETGNNGQIIITPRPVIPGNPPVDTIASPSRLGAG